MSTEHLQRVVARLTRGGDKEAADLIDKIVADLAQCEIANEQLEAKVGVAEKARDDSEARNDFLIAELEALIAKAKTPEPQS